MFKQKLSKLKKHLRRKLHLVPENQYKRLTASFGLSFAVGVTIQRDLDFDIKIGLISVGLLIFFIGILMDMRISRQRRSY